MKHYKMSFTLIALVILVISCKKYDAKGNEIKKYDELQKAYWLLGEWEKTDSIGTLKEIWNTKDDSTYVGQSYFIKDEKDTIHFETIELMQDKEHLIYTATVKGENNDQPISFQMTKDEDNLLVFENPKHDYPQKIEYRLMKDKSLIAKISGKLNGKASQESYPMKKIN